MPTTEAYPAPQNAMTTDRQVNAVDNLKQQDGKRKREKWTL